MTRQETARDILTYCKANNKKFLAVVYSKNRISKFYGKDYSPHALGRGLSYLHKMGVVSRVSKTRWMIHSYEMPR